MALNLPMILFGLSAGFIWWSLRTVQNIPNFPIMCELAATLAHAGSSAWILSVAIRQHHYECIFLKHSPAEHPVQSGLKYWPLFCLPELLRWIQTTFEKAVGRNSEGLCAWDLETSPWPPSGSGFDWAQFLYATADTLATIPPYAVTFVVITRITWRLRKIRNQFNQFKATAVALVLSLGAFIPALAGFGRELSSTVYGSAVLLNYIVLVAPLTWNLLVNEAAYMRQYTYGFSTMPTAAELNESLRHQLTLPEVREKFRAFANRAHAEESLEFYEKCIARSTELDYVKRQALTMEILERHIFDGAERPINISHTAKQAILNNPNITDPDLFKKAQTEVIFMLEDNFGRAWQDSSEIGDLKNMIRAESQERESLRAAGLMGEGNARNMKSISAGSLMKSTLAKSGLFSHRMTIVEEQDDDDNEADVICEQTIQAPPPAAIREPVFNPLPGQAIAPNDERVDPS